MFGSVGVIVFENLVNWVGSSDEKLAGDELGMLKGLFACEIAGLGSLYGTWF